MSSLHFELMCNAIKEIEPSLIISGGASGADKLAEEIALLQRIPIRIVRANWATYGKAAGPMRNGAMLGLEPDLVLAFHPKSGITKGTLDMVTKARKAGVEVRIITYD